MIAPRDVAVVPTLQGRFSEPLILAGVCPICRVHDLDASASSIGYVESAKADFAVFAFAARTLAHDFLATKINIPSFKYEFLC